MVLVDLLTTLGPAVAGLGGLVSGTRIVHENERGMKLRFGKTVRHKSGPNKGQPKVVMPGFRVLIPAVDQLRKTHIRTTTLNLDTQTIMLKDQTVYEVGAMVRVKIRDDAQAIYQALFETSGLWGTVANHCAAELRALIATMNSDQMSDPEALGEQALERVKHQLDEWGVTIVSFPLTDCSPTPATAQLLLIGAATRFRVEALMAAADRLLLGERARRLDPSLAAALIGTPIGVQIGGIPGQRAIGADQLDSDELSG